MGKKDNQTAKEPAWLNPANDRKTPYTDEEIEVFVDGFILGLDDHEWTLMKIELGEEKAREKIRAAIIRMDERNLVNMASIGTLQ